ncbi:hypothetical protein WICMUC_000086 [Wickerhamomyces mucosus]|uniref:Autophagy-related protein 9 n=1 Tax=Wickerhamomyces mucosus TaxID=1378264 RepID=A0A9P8TIM2_9ASCO|nr:hypothetical protein WICMUC_000086 [Wickerhamomyces mucosus]
MEDNLENEEFILTSSNFETILVLEGKSGVSGGEVGGCCLQLETKALYLIENIWGESNKIINQLNSLAIKLSPTKVYTSPKIDSQIHDFLMESQSKLNFLVETLPSRSFNLKQSNKIIEDALNSIIYSKSSIISKLSNLKSGKELSMARLSVSALLTQYQKSLMFEEDIVDDGFTSFQDIVRTIEIFIASDYMYLDIDSLYSLQILNTPGNNSKSTQRGVKTCLIDLINHTGSQLGFKFLNDMMLSPLANLQLIQERLKIVKVLVDPINASMVEELIILQRKLGNINKILDSIKTGKSSFMIWLNFEKFLQTAVKICEICFQFRNNSLDLVNGDLFPFWDKLLNIVDLKNINELIKQINFIIDFDSSKDWNRIYIRDGINTELDNLKQKYNTLETVLHDLAIDLSNEYSIRGDDLNVVYIPQLGYLISINLETSDSIPNDWVGVFSTSTNCYYKEAFMNQMDIDYGDVYQLIIDFEIEIMYDLQTKVMNDYSQNLVDLGNCLAELDCFLSFAKGSTLLRFCEPQIVTDPILYIEKGRHPLHEQSTNAFIANNTSISNDYVNVITGANGSGKSVYLTHLGIIVYLTHIGCYVPATHAKIGLCDRLLTRIITMEAMDIYESTFFIDLKRMSKCLELKTEKSILLIDEFGKGTDTFGGASLLGSIIEKLCNDKLGTRTILTTHFHELFEKGIIDQSKVKHNHMEILFETLKPTTAMAITSTSTAAAAAESDITNSNRLTYLYRLQDGLCNNSFGIECAKVCGIPQNIIVRAKEISQEDKNWDKVANEARLERAKKITREFLMWDLDNPLDEIELRTKLLDILKLRVFGANSSYASNEAELSSLRNVNINDEESQLPLIKETVNNSQSKAQRKSVIESDDDDDDEALEEEEEEDQYRQNSSANKNHADNNNINHLHEIKEKNDEYRDGEVPMSIMFHQNEFDTTNNESKIKNNRKQTIDSPPLSNDATPLSIPPTQISNKKPATNYQNNSNKNVYANNNNSNINDDERIRRANLGILNPKERALWKWANVENLDNFLQDVYSYYLGNGYYCIILSKLFDLATLIFVVYFSTYLTACIDYSKLKSPTTKGLNDITIDRCYSKISFTGKFCLFWIFIYFILKSIQLYVDAKQLVEIHNFYKYLLEISDKDLQTISWQVVVHRIMLLKDQNAITSNVADMKSKSRIDAHDIANRIMRKENYFIALFSKDILDLTLPIPGYSTNVLTRTLEWNLQLCITGLVFNEHGQVRQQFLKESNRREMSNELKKRFMLAGVLNIIISPLLVTYFLLLYFFRYFNEYKKNPGSIGSRQYTPLAEWKFREFNELYHIFQKRLNLSVPEASKYIDQFPKEKMVVILKFVAFVSGSFAAVLGILSIVDPDMFFNFEITKDKTVLFYITIFGTIWAVSHGAIPEEYQVFDSETSLKKVAYFTHFLPDHWEGKYHTEEVRNEFCEFFNLKAISLIREIASLIMTPFILWFSLPKSSDRIVDFFREYSVHVDGLGYVCTFAMFNFEKIKNNNNRFKKQERTTHYNSSEEKMMKSYLYFLDSYGDYETQRNPVNNNNKTKYHHPLHNSSGLKSPRFVKSKPTLSQSVYGKSSQSPQNWFHSRSKQNDDLNTKSFILDPVDKQGINVPRFTVDEKSLSEESFITALPKTDTNDIDSNKDPGVLGLLNQFYKDYHIAH